MIPHIHKTRSCCRLGRGTIYPRRTDLCNSGLSCPGPALTPTRRSRPMCRSARLRQLHPVLRSWLSARLPSPAAESCGQCRNAPATRAAASLPEGGRLAPPPRCRPAEHAANTAVNSARGASSANTSAARRIRHMTETRAAAAAAARW